MIFSAEEGLSNALLGAQFGGIIANIAYDLTDLPLKFSIFHP